MNSLKVELEGLETTGTINTNALMVVSEFKQKRNSFKRKAWNLFYKGLKRTFDICCGIAGCIALLPIMLVVKIAYLLHKDTAPILFKQERIGLNGKKIYIYKIRSMVPNAEQVLEELMEKNPEIKKEYLKNKKLENDPRITPVGNFIRKTSLDEFGQFINVLKGEMSMIGPRPYLPREKEDMKMYYEDIIKCKPGVTGLWQAYGRSKIGFENRCRLDSFYSKRMCAFFDWKIFIKTFSAVIKGEGAV